MADREWVSVSGSYRYVSGDLLAVVVWWLAGRWPRSFDPVPSMRSGFLRTPLPWRRGTHGQKFRGMCRTTPVSLFTADIMLMAFIAPFGVAGLAGGLQYAAEDSGDTTGDIRGIPDQPGYMGFNLTPPRAGEKERILLHNSIYTVSYIYILKLLILLFSLFAVWFVWSCFTCLIIYYMISCLLCFLVC